MIKIKSKKSWVRPQQPQIDIDTIDGKLVYFLVLQEYQNNFQLKKKMLELTMNSEVTDLSPRILLSV